MQPQIICNRISFSARVVNFVFGPSTKSAAMRSKNGTTVLPCVLIIVRFISCPSVSCPGEGVEGNVCLVLIG